MNQQPYCDDTIAISLFSDWQKLEQHAQYVLRQCNDDLSDIAYINAEKRSWEALRQFLGHPTSSIPAISLKLQLACLFEDFVLDAIDPASDLVAPRAIISALHDLQRVVAKSCCACGH